MGYNIWKDCPQKPLPEVLSFVVDNRGKTVPTTETGHILIATNCVKNENLFPVYEKIRFLSDETYENWFRAHPVPGDILFVCKGTPGRCCLVPDPIDFCIAQDMVALRCDPKQIYHYYLLAVLRSRVIQMQIANTSVGDVIPHFKKSHFNTLMIPIPPMEIQKKIGNLYYELSLKQEVNKQINKNLEQQAQAIYKAWFVDFSAFGGTAPNDWQTYHLVDFLPVITGKKNANVSSNQGKYPFFSCSQDYAWTDDYSFDGSAILVAGNGDFNVKFYSGKFEAYQRTYVLIPYEPKYTAWLFYAVQYHLSSITSAARGSVIKFITKGNLEDFEFVAPKVPLSLPVIYNLDTINRKIATNREENLRLGTLRDTLLPKLMSGELDVSNVEI